MSLDGDVDKLAAHYRTWADEYDADVAGHEYGLPASMVRTLVEALERLEPDAPARADGVAVLDAGCGTGLVAEALHAAGWTALDGVDLSEEMVDKAAERGIFRSLRGGVDLTVPPDDTLRHSAAIVTVGGVFTVGHVPPSALGTIAELVEPGGLLVASFRRAYIDGTDLTAEIERLEAAGTLEPLVHLADQPYTMDSLGDFHAWRVPG